MFYKMPESVRNFIFQHFTKTSGLPISYEQIQGMLAQITPIEEKCEKKEECKTPEKK